MPRKRPELPTDDELPTGTSQTSEISLKVPLKVAAIARFSHFPYDLLARYVNHKVEFTVEKLWFGTGKELETPWIVTKLT